MHLALLLGLTLQTLSGFETVKVADGIHAFIATQTDSALVSGNMTAIVGDDGVLLVDTGHFPSGTKRMLAKLRELTPLPVRYVVNTHWHPDHNTGNSAVLDAFPQAVIISTQATREAFDAELPKFEPAAMKPIGAKLREALRTGKTSKGVPLTDDQRKRFAGMLEDLEGTLPDLEQGRHMPAQLTFARELRLWLGKREVDVRFLGRGNTAGDAVVYVPDTKTLMTGDLVVYPTPYAFGSFFGEWVQTMDALLAIDAAAIVPGHGPVLHDKTYLQAVRALLAEMVAQAKAGVDHKDLKLASRRELTHGDAKLEHDLDTYVLDPGYPRALREAKEGPLKDEN